MSTSQRLPSRWRFRYCGQPWFTVVCPIAGSEPPNGRADRSIKPGDVVDFDHVQTDGSVRATTAVVVQANDERVLLKPELFPDVLSPEPLPMAVALSGGGHRATLFGLGGLLALVDLQLNTAVRQIASVSGGSIVNMAVANECDFATLMPEELDPIAQKVASRIVRTGVITRRWVFGVLGTAAVIAAAAGYGVFRATGHLNLGLLAAFLCAVTMHMLMGTFVQRRIGSYYFSPNSSRVFGDIPRRFVDHVVCATDLVTGQPVYFSTRDGGTLLRRRLLSRKVEYGYAEYAPNNPLVYVAFEPTLEKAIDASRVRVAEAVRSSAGFPGIPPHRMHIRAVALDAMERRPRRRSRLEQLWDPYERERPFEFGGQIIPRTRKPESPATSTTMYLADGGIINNLATQAAREDQIVSGLTERPLPVLCINASAAERAAPRWLFLIPLISQIASLSRTVKILLGNTISSREREATRANLVRQYSQRRPGHFDPLDVLVSIVSTPAQTLEQLKGHTVADAYNLISSVYIADSDPKVVVWSKSLLRQLNAWASKAEDSRSDAELLSMIKKSIDRRPKGSNWTPGFVEADFLKNLQLPGSLPIDVSYAEAPTTLGRVQKDVACGLLFQGYINTALTSLVLRSDTWTQLTALSFFGEENLRRVQDRMSRCTEPTQDSGGRTRKRSRPPAQ